MMPNDPTLRAAIEAVNVASRVARTVQSALDDLRSITKDDRSPVTVADFAVQAIVTSMLHDAIGPVEMIGEEDSGVLRQADQSAVRDAVIKAVQTALPQLSGDDVLNAIDAGNHDGSAKSYWTLDPVDGTKGFLRGQQYAIALGRIDEGQVTLGVMGCPNLPTDFNAPLDVADNTGVTYAAMLGHGAWTAAGERLTASAEIASTGIRVCESVEKGHSKQSDSARIAEAVGGAGTPVRLDSQCKYAVVARGQADAYLRLPTRRDYQEKIWDHAAGKLIAEEAGAIVSDITGAPLDFGHGPHLSQNRGVICAIRPIHEKIIAAIDELGIAALPAG